MFYSHNLELVIIHTFPPSAITHPFIPRHNNISVVCVQLDMCFCLNISTACVH
jgi:hypothetical protein